MIPNIVNLEGWIDFAEALAPVAAGTSLQTSAEIDRGADMRSMLVFVRLGTPATDNTVGITSSETSGGTFAANGVTALEIGATNNWLVLRVEDMKFRYFKVVVTRGTSTTVDIAFAIPYGNMANLLAPASDWTTNATFAGYVTPEA